MKFGRNVLNQNTRRLTKLDFRFDVTVSRWHPCRHLTKKSAAIWSVHTKNLLICSSFRQFPIHSTVPRETRLMIYYIFGFADCFPKQLLYTRRDINTTCPCPKYYLHLVKYKGKKVLYSCWWDVLHGAAIRSVTFHMGSHSVTCHPTQVNTPRLNPSQTGRYSIYLPRRDGRLSWPSHLGDLLYIPRWFTRPQTVTRPSTNRAQCRLTTLIEANALTTTLRRHPQLLQCYTLVTKEKIAITYNRQCFPTNNWYSSCYFVPYLQVNGEYIYSNKVVSPFYVVCYVV